MNRLFSFLIALFLLAGCMSPSIIQNPQSYEKKGYSKLVKRVAAYYSFLQQKKYERMYRMEVPSFRYFYDFTLYRGYYGGFKKFDRIDILKIEPLDDKIYKVKLRFYRRNKPLFTLLEKWVQIGGEYYHDLYDPFIFNK